MFNKVKDCVITVLYNSLYFTVIYKTDKDCAITFLKFKALEQMKKYIIREDVLSKVKALLKIGKEKNVIIEFNESGSIISALDNLEEFTPCLKKCNETFYNVFFTGIDPINEILHEGQTLIRSELGLSVIQINTKISLKYNIVRVNSEFKTIQKEEFDILKEEIEVI